ncbi:aminotransferase class V-fold PLP-dependent enzyme [Paraclostridium bifermentans]|uniref:aminotransferase class V-fold PLP-dependent enzyme n=1 Tax=Paraclostridium bifermentans TaxID=1490 RepID=UPI001C107B2C|nr:aminotransferase class V-fold PLP-dependent enzyme [Paraclostridium bifermentans]MBS5954786.1 aminotransferase class V-fold PLP-dependent enzyme [Paraclostridium bifermentans]MBU5289939.1 aminotransferase class V-fold PLP-dependent enzyme [Paraclostridium bifermentans]
MYRKEVNYRPMFDGVDLTIKLGDGAYATPICFDNGATTPPFKCVDREIFKHMQMYGSIGRGKGPKSEYSNRVYEKCRDYVKEYFNLKDDDRYTVIFTKNTTEGINLLAHALINSKYDKVITTRMEHHANDLPWRYNANVIYIDVDNQGKLKIDDIEEQLIKNRGEVKFVSVTGASNVTGYVNPIHHIAKLAHKYGAKIIIDAAQLAPHREINMKGTGNDDAIDFLALSAHKMYAPYGTGVVVGLKEDLEDKEPFLKGGGAVDLVFDYDIYWSELPSKFEAGTPNYLGVVAMYTAMNKLKEIGFDKIQEHEELLKNRLIKGLEDIDRVVLYGDSNDKDRLGVITFNVDGINFDSVADRLSYIRGIAVRQGAFCAHTYVRRLLGIDDAEAQKLLNRDCKVAGMVRASLGLYNTTEEVDEFLNTMEFMINRCRHFENNIF